MSTGCSGAIAIRLYSRVMEQVKDGGKSWIVLFVKPNIGGKNMTRFSPNKPFDVLVDQVIDTDLQVRKEDNADLGSSVEAEQDDFDFEG
jgi:hypothetical protein